MSHNIGKLVAFVLLAGCSAWGQTPAAKESANEDANLQAYADLLRSDIRSMKTQVLSTVMQFSPEEAAMFWPIYKTYDEQMRKEGDQRLAVIQEYAASYSSLTDAKADELVGKFMSLRSQRDALLGKCYQQVREKMGGKAAARFLQVESQLLHLIDLKIASLLPVVE